MHSNDNKLMLASVPVEHGLDSAILILMIVQNHFVCFFCLFFTHVDGQTIDCEMGQ